MGTNVGKFDSAVDRGKAYRVSKRQSIDDGQEFTIHFIPADDGQTLFIESPAIDPEELADIDIYENAEPNEGETNDDVYVHNMRYDVDAENEEPDATVLRVNDSELDTANADKTEETLVRQGGEYQTPGGEERRGLWRIISGDETVTVVITDRSGGNNNICAFDTVIYEGLSWG